MSAPDSQTLAVYDAKAREYGDKFVDAGTDNGLLRFIASLRPGARVLDLGCGVGHSAARMRDDGLEVVALDASAGMAAEAERRYGLDVIVSDFDALPDLGRFDGVWASFSLLHAPRADLPRHLQAIHAALSPGGQFMIGMKVGHGTGRDPLGRIYTYVGADELQALLTKAGFTIDRLYTGADEGLDGRVAPWIVLFAHA
ncbi:MAG: class I SAM-dependent methyltransferase [Pseudomonadota bacterium]